MYQQNNFLIQILPKPVRKMHEKTKKQREDFNYKHYEDQMTKYLFKDQLNSLQLDYQKTLKQMLLQLISHLKRQGKCLKVKIWIIDEKLRNQLGPNELIYFVGKEKAKIIN